VNFVQNSVQTFGGFTGSVMGEEVDPDRMYEIKAGLDASGIYLQDEVDEFSHIFFAPKRKQS